METQFAIDHKINEAEACRSMELFSDSLRIYEQVLECVSEQDVDIYGKIRNRIRTLQQEIRDREGRRVRDITGDELNSLIDQLPDQNDSGLILDKAMALREMGLHSKAVPEFATLFKEDCSIEIYVPELIDSLLKINTPAKALNHLEELLAKQTIDKQKSAQIRFLFGRDLEKRDHREQALEIYRDAHKIDPANHEIKKSMASIAAAFASGSRYDYLLKEKIVTTNQLQKALALSKKMTDFIDFSDWEDMGLWGAMADEFAQEERSSRRWEREAFRDPEDEPDLDNDMRRRPAAYKYSKRRTRRKPFEQYAYEVAVGLKHHNDPLYGPAKLRRGGKQASK